MLLVHDQKALDAMRESLANARQLVALSPRTARQEIEYAHQAAGRLRGRSPPLDTMLASLVPPVMWDRTECMKLSCRTPERSKPATAQGVYAPEVNLDFQRQARIGLDEAVLCGHKTPAQLTHILAEARAASRPLLLTRLSEAQLHALSPADRDALDYEPVSRTAYFGSPRALSGTPRIAVLSAGSSDAHVTREAQRTLAFSGVPSTLIADVGVAGLWRLLDKVELLRTHKVAIVAAGMDAALPSVVGGLFGGVIIGVATSTGYGVAEGGHTALNTILASCAPGVLTLNIDNGYGAACAAMRVLHVIDT